jgi:hypothetical protein
VILSTTEEFDLWLEGETVEALRLAEQKRSAELQLAERKFQYDRDLHDHKRRVELAEGGLADFYRFADIIWAVRSPGGFKDETASRPRTESETPADTRKLYHIDGRDHQARATGKPRRNANRRRRREVEGLTRTSFSYLPSTRDRRRLQLG